MCRRELDKAESEIRKNSSIIGDYKQVSECTVGGPHALEALLAWMSVSPPHPGLPGSATRTDRSLYFTGQVTSLIRNGKIREMVPVSENRHEGSIRSCL